MSHGNWAAKKAAHARVDELLRSPGKSTPELRDEPVLVAACLLVCVIGDRERSSFVTPDGTLKWSLQTLAGCLGYGKELSQRAVKSAENARWYSSGSCWCTSLSYPNTPRLQAIRQCTLDELRRQRPAPRVPGWQQKPERVKSLFKDLLLKSHKERRFIRNVVRGDQECPRELTSLLAPLAKWPQDDLRVLEKYLM